MVLHVCIYVYVYMSVLCLSMSFLSLIVGTTVGKLVKKGVKNLVDDKRSVTPLSRHYSIRSREENVSNFCTVSSIRYLFNLFVLLKSITLTILTPVHYLSLTQTRDGSGLTSSFRTDSPVVKGFWTYCTFPR